MYYYRNLTPEQQNEVVEYRRQQRRPWHSPPHWNFDRAIKSYRHFWATVNYIHNNPVHHSNVDEWRDWPWSSATDFIERVGRVMAEKIWRKYPILDYGKK
jgi:REP-associated tyrosine transposase